MIKMELEQNGYWIKELSPRASSFVWKALGIDNLAPEQLHARIAASIEDVSKVSPLQWKNINCNTGVLSEIGSWLAKYGYDFKTKVDDHKGAITRGQLREQSRYYLINSVMDGFTRQLNTIKDNAAIKRRVNDYQREIGGMRSINDYSEDELKKCNDSIIGSLEDLKNSIDKFIQGETPIQ